MTYEGPSIVVAEPSASHARPPSGHDDRLRRLALQHLHEPPSLERVPVRLPLRNAIQADRLPAVLQAAGVPMPSLDAARALADAAARSIADRLESDRPPLPWRQESPPDLAVLAAARQAATGPGMRMAMQLAGLPRAAYPPDTVREALAVEIARIAQQAAGVARERHHDVDRSCIEEAVATEGALSATR